MGDVFKALSDQHRRRLLDILREQDGQTLQELEAHFAEMSRFGVMKHLRILEEASLVATKKVGRFKHHYLNVIPIQEIADRWISAFAAPWSTTITQLKYQLEGHTMTTKPKHVFVTIIRTTPQKLWAALTDGNITPAYYYGGRFEGKLEVGADYAYRAPDGENFFVRGKIEEIVPEKKLVASFKGEWMPDMKDDAPSRITWEIIQQGECCRLVLTHDGFDTENATYTITGGGWPGILSGLKTYLETGTPLNYNPMAA